jgi:hypothetical protein
VIPRHASIGRQKNADSVADSVADSRDMSRRDCAANPQVTRDARPKELLNRLAHHQYHTVLTEIDFRFMHIVCS